jgi:hypothetical protein
MIRVLEIILIGAGATACIDLWALLLWRVFGVRSLDYCLLGRWVLYMRRGKIVHENIAASSAQQHECKIGWGAHYSIGVAFAILFAMITVDGWFLRPTLVPALLFGIATVALPFFTMQPAFGLGIAASRTKNPNAARLKSLSTHAVFGGGLYLSAWLLSRAS